ncbi:MAG: zinc-ribbon domain containing protein [Candidatus Levybacteria bacterium]|nr:zinc-ribbon domain containing protein [Candidatus Levybacteria bacterium]
MPGQPITCAKCGKKFLVIEPEEKFLREKGLPNPIHCPSCRQLRRLMLRGNDRALFKTKCQQCGKEIVVSYDPNKIKNKILCREDYDKWLTEHNTVIEDPLPTI